jgi:hypothetical protein
MRFNTFDEVKNWYESTKPVREKEHNTARDIRPIDERRYKGRRIVKVDDSCYVLSDGWHYGGGVTDPYDHNSGYVPITVDLVRFAPIVWRRDASGTETIAVRNAGYGSNTTASRHAFLRNHLPNWITLVTGNNNGKHFLRYTQGKTFFPKATALPQQVYDAVKSKKVYHGRWATLTDKATLLFQREGNAFILLSDPVPEPMKRIDKDAKAPYAKAIREFREWSLIMAPLLSYDWRTASDARSALTTWSKGKPEAYRAVILNAEHPQRVNMLICMVRDVVGWRQDDQLRQGDLERIAKGSKAWVNRYCGFIKTEPR